MLTAEIIDTAVRTALAEDGPWGDVTSDGLLPAGVQARLAIRAKSDGVLCGLPLAAAVFRAVEPAVRWEPLLEDGAGLAPGNVVATLTGEARHLLRGERIALNFLQRLSGVATLTAAYVARAADGAPHARILDTRKTTPGLRALEKYAVRCGGGQNHRHGLSDGILVKDNHMAVLAHAGVSLAEGLAGLRRHASFLMPVQVEVESVAAARAALEAGADALLLDNMSDEDMRAVVQLARAQSARPVRTEASGNMSLERVAAVAATGVDYISVGALTHSAVALDLSLDFEV